MTTYKPLVLIAGLDQQLDSADALDVSTIDTATLNLTGNLTVTGSITGDTLNVTSPAYTEKTGWDLLYNDEVTLTFNDANRTFTIAPTGNSFHFWVQGTKYTKTTAQTVTINDTYGLWFIKFDNTGTLVASQTPWSIQDDDAALVAYLYWDQAAGEHIGLGYELHSWTMDPGTHAALHNTVGAIYDSGFALGDMTVDGNGDQKETAQLSVGNGIFYDEDIKHTITNNSPQQLEFPAQLPIYYRSGASGNWNVLPATGYLGYADTANGSRMHYNEWTGATWQLTEIGNNDFGLAHIFATNDVNEPIIIIMGQGDYPTLGQARDGAETEINELVLGGFAEVFKEFIPIATIILQTSNGYDDDDNDILARVRSTDDGDDYIDWRGQYTAGGAVSGTTDHSLLSNLAADDHTQYVLADGTRTITATSGLVLIDTGNNTVNSSGNGSVIVSGENQTINAYRAAIIGGYYNTVNGLCANSVICGGYQNVVMLNHSGILGGRGVTVNAAYAAGVGGQTNSITGNHAVQIGGQNMDVLGSTSAGVGGYLSDVEGELNVVAGGQQHTTTSDANNSGIIAGKNCTLNGVTCFIAGSQSSNMNDCLESAIVGGNDLTCCNDKSFIGSGYTVTVNGYAAASVGGRNNNVTGSYASALGGKDNTINGTRATAIGGGLCTLNDAYSSGIFSGWNCTIETDGDYCVVVGGFSNNISGNNDYSAIVGGYENTVNGEGAAVVGGQSSNVQSDHSVVCGGNSHTVLATKYAGFIGGGWNNTINGAKSGILAGRDNETREFYTAILGGQDNLVTAKYGVAFGKYADNEQWGSLVHSGGRQTSTGDCQLIRCNVQGKTSNGVSADLTLDGVASANSAAKLVMPENSVWYLKANVIATNNVGNYGCAYRIYAALRRSGSNQPVYMGLGTAASNPVYYLDWEDNASFNIALHIRSGAVIAIGAAQPSISQDFKWNALVEIVQAIGGF